MNKMKKNYLMFAALVATTLGFTACSSEDGLADAEQGQQQERGVVKTQFTISIPQANSGMTRLASDKVQSTEALKDFRGIRGIELYPFSSVVSSTYPAPGTSVPSRILLVGSSTNGKYGSSGEDNYSIGGGKTNLFETSQSHLYQDVDIPLGTKSFMFYGEAAGEADASVQGKLNKETSGTTLSGIKFSLAPIHADGTVGTYGTKIATYLTSIANATSGDKKWIQTDNVGLASLFEQFTGENTETHSLTNNGIKAGAWTNVKAALRELYKNLAERSSDSQTTKDMKTAIRSAIANSTYGVTASGNELTFTNVMYKEENDKEIPYPRDLGLPDGAAYVRWNVANQAFEALADNAYTGSNFASLGSYVYPASLYYRVLSNIKTSSTIKGVGTDGYNETITWDDILKFYNPSAAEADAGYDNTTVSSKTRSIVITDPVQYAVARLDATIKASSENLKDNPNNNTNTRPTFDVGSSSENFKVTGILIGGQKSVNYKFEQNSEEGTFKTIYDNSIGSDMYLRSTNSTPVYSLALETKSATSDADESAIVKIAVEFENNSGKTIVGKNKELIYPGCRFYLIGTLNPSLNPSQTYDGSTADPTNHPELIIKKAFVQDFKTVVTLSVSSLENAYNTLPDLTLPQLEMGLAVDLHWRTGIIQTINME